MRWREWKGATLALRLVIPLSWLQAVPAPVQAERLPITTYSIADGLVHSAVRCLHQDAKGYLWIGTAEGLSRFDGYRFTNYGLWNGLGHSLLEGERAKRERFRQMTNE